MHEFAYCFAINNEVKWSAEDTNSLTRRINENEAEKVAEFIENSEPGNFITLNDGTLLFRCAANNNSNNKN